MNSVDSEYDDLTVIGGIGEKRQGLIRQSLNVRTYQDLANLPVDKTVSVLKDKGHIVSRDTVKQWVAEANMLAATTEPSSQRDQGSTKVEAGEQVNTRVEGDKEDEWEWLKAFVVEFCVLKLEEQVKKREIRVYPLKVSQKGVWLDNGETKKSPEIIKKGESLYPWMVEQFGEQEWQELDKDIMKGAIPVAEPTAEPAREPVNVDVIQIRAFQPLDTEKPTSFGEAGQPFIGLVMSEKPFALEADFVIHDVATADIVWGKTTYRANFFIQNMTTAEKMTLGDTKSTILIPEKDTYTARLSHVTLESGRYRLGALVKVQSKPPSVGHLELPMLNVV
jgi:hypothetical protein